MSELIRRREELPSGAVYTVTGFRKKIDGFDIDFIGWKNAMPHDQNDNFSLEDLNRIARKVFPKVPRKNIRIRAHSGAGMNITVKAKIDKS